MNLQTFESFTLNARAVTTWLEGTLLGVRLGEGYNCGLYHLGSFFVEVRYRPQTDEVLLVRGFTDQRLLEPYLETIELPRDWRP